MAHRPPDVSVFREIQRVAQNLNHTRMEVLHPGLELGRLRPARQAAPLWPSASPEATVAPVTTPAAMSPQPQVAEAPLKMEPPSIPLTAVRPSPQNADTKMPKPASARWSRWLIAHACDVVIVLLTLLVAGLTVELIMNPHGFSLGRVPKFLPIAVVRYLGFVKSSLVIAMIFIAYRLIFRVFAGQTLGEAIMKNPRLDRPAVARKR